MTGGGQPMACPSEQRLIEFLSGRLPDADLVEVAAHLGTCAACCARAQAMPTVPDEFESQLRGLSGAGQSADTRAESAAGTPRSTGQIGARLDEYVLLWPIGEGGMSRVWRAVHQRLGRPVAVKLLSERRAADPTAASRFTREMALIGQLEHPNIVRATDAGESNGTLFLVMELVEGIDAGRLLATAGPLPIADACEIARQTGVALAYAHKTGLVHRDVKPSNLMITPQGTVKLLDLGLALFWSNADSAATASGVILGTPNYMAPEQADDPRRVDGRADLYSLGCALYEWLTGAPPFGGSDYSTPFRKLQAHATVEPAPVRESRPETPPALAAVVARMLAKSPGDRFASADDVVDALAPWTVGADLPRLVTERTTPGDAAPPAASRALRARPVARSRRRPLLWAAVAVALAVTVAAAWSWRSRPDATDGAVIVVTSPGDGGGLTLRAALARAEASGRDCVIRLPAGVIELVRELPPIKSTVEVVGAGMHAVTITRARDAPPFRLLTVAEGGNVRLHQLTLRGGHARDGGGVSNAGHLALFGVQIDGCESSGSGGGIFNFGTLRLAQCAIANNVSADWGGGIYSSGRVSIHDCTIANNVSHAHGGGIYSSGSMSFSNCTVSGNRAARYGGGIVLDGGKATINETTITDNQTEGATGGGLRVFNAPDIRIVNCIIAGNRRSAGPDDVSLFNGTLTGRNNLIGAAPPDCGLHHGEAGNQIGTIERPIDAGLGPLADNGGPTRTHLPAAGSPVLNAGDVGNSAPADQRGQPRKPNSPNDIGSVQRQPHDQS